MLNQTKKPGTIILSSLPKIPPRGKGAGFEGLEGGKPAGDETDSSAALDDAASRMMRAIKADKAPDFRRALEDFIGLCDTGSDDYGSEED